MAAAILLVAARASWSKPSSTIGDDTHIKHYSSYLDPGTLKTHIAFCMETTTEKGETTQELHYACLSPSNELVVNEQISGRHGCRVARITGDGTTRNLIIAFEGQRKFHQGVCNETNPKGCYDVFVTSSTEEGYVWSEPVPVSRTSVTDVADRLSPFVVANNATKRVYVFYTYRTMDRTVPVVAYVTRSPASKVFGTEIVTRTEAEERLITVLTTLNRGRTMLHIFVENKGQTKQVYTENMITWGENVVLDDKVHFSSFVANPAVAASFVAGIMTDGDKTLIAGSDDHGKTWPAKYQFVLADKYHRISAGAICPFGDSFKLHLILTSFMQVDQTYYAVNVMTGEKEKRDAPFTGIENYGVFMPQMWCFTAESTQKVALKALAYVWEKPNEPRVFASTNEDI